ncbi:hypothetical protein CHUAL_011981 [Chamberlinius hualienensis]
MASESEECETENVIVSEEAVNINEDGDEIDENGLVTVVEFNEGLIYLIRDRPVLWDNRDKDYSDKSLKMVAWEEIASLISKDVDTIQKRWLSLRDRYARELKKMRNLESQGLSQCVARQWNYFELMSFLRDIVKPRTSKPVEKQSYVPIKVTGAVDTSWRDGTIIRTCISNTPQIKSKTSTTSFADDLLADLKPSGQNKRKLPLSDDESKQSNSPGLMAQDPDEAFCTSLVHYFKVLSPQKKIKAQIDILQVLQGNM